MLNPCVEFVLLPDGHLIYATNSFVWKIPIDEKTGRPTGSPRQVSDVQAIDHPTASADGERLVVLKGNNGPASGLRRSYLWQTWKAGEGG